VQHHRRAWPTLALLLVLEGAAATHSAADGRWQLETALVAQALESRGVGSAAALTATYSGQLTWTSRVLSWNLEVEGSQDSPRTKTSELAGLVGSQWAFNELLEENGLFVAVARVTGTLADGAVEWQAGKISPKNSMDGNRAARSKSTKFLAGPFAKNSAVAFAGKGLGLSGRWTISPTSSLALCASDANARSTKAGLSSLRGEWYRAGEFTWRPVAGVAVRVLLWRTERQGRADGGWGTSNDWEIAPHVVVFLRAGGGGRRFPASESLWAGGLAWERPFGRAEDYAGVGWARGRALGTERFEHRVELFYRWQINRWSAFSPHGQWFRGAGGGPSRDGWLVGCRLVLAARG
jgi:hypothetical protein